MTADVRDYDWSEIVFDLKRSGMDQTEICVRLQRRLTEGMIRQYMAGTSAPTHWRGEMLLKLWCERTGRPRDAAPTKPAHITHAVRAPRRTRSMPSADALEELCRMYRLPPRTVMDLIHRHVQQRARLHGAHRNLTLPGLDLE